MTLTGLKINLKWKTVCIYPRCLKDGWKVYSVATYVAPHIVWSFIGLTAVASMWTSWQTRISMSWWADSFRHTRHWVSRNQISDMVSCVAIKSKPCLFHFGVAHKVADIIAGRIKQVCGKYRFLKSNDSRYRQALSRGKRVDPGVMTRIQHIITQMDLELPVIKV